MLKVLEEEQAAENGREDEMSKINDPQERKRLEKIFGMERAKAQARIQQLSEYIKMMMNYFYNIYINNNF